MKAEAIRAVLFTLIVFIFLFHTSVIRAEGIPNYGPGFLHIRAQSPAQSFRMTMPKVLPGSIRPGWSYIFGATLSNIWINDPLVKLDYELVDQHFTVMYGMNEHWGFAIVYDQREYVGGVLDGLIQDFHKIFDMGQDGRDLVGKGQTSFTRFDEQGVEIFQTVDLGELDNRSITLLAQHVIGFGEGREPAVSLTGGIRHIVDLPISGGDDDRLDWSIGIGFTKRLWEDWYACVHLGHQEYDQTNILGMIFSRNARTIMGALAWDVSHKVDLIAQYHFNDGIVTNFSPFGESSHEINAGVKVRVSHAGKLEFAILENLFTFDNGPDLGFHAAYKHQF